MEAPQIGCYITLLAQCWTQDQCTLPSDPLILQRLSKWRDSYGDFQPVLACFPPFKKTGRVTNPRLYAEWQEARTRTEVLSESGQRGAEKRWAQKPTPPGQAKRKTVPHIRRNWLADLQADPFYGHVPWPLEHVKMDKWLLAHPGRKKNRAFVLSWINKIEPPLSNGSASLTCPHHPQLTFLDHHAKKAHDFDYHTKPES